MDLTQRALWQAFWRRDVSAPLSFWDALDWVSRTPLRRVPDGKDAFFNVGTIIDSGCVDHLERAEEMIAGLVLPIGTFLDADSLVIAVDYRSIFVTNGDFLVGWFGEDLTVSLKRMAVWIGSDVETHLMKVRATGPIVPKSAY